MSAPPPGRGPRPAALLVPFLTTALTLVLMAAVLSAAGSTPLTGAPDAREVSLVRAGTCTDVAVVAVDGAGSGWGGASTLSPVLTTFSRSLVARAEAAGSSVSVRHLGVDFPSSRTLVAGSLTRPAVDAISRPRVRSWSAQVPGARDAVARELTALAAACPDQTFVLAGVAQGATTQHRVLSLVPRMTVLDGHVVGAVLVSDSDRTSGTRATLLGTPVARSTGRGVVPTKLGASTDAPAPGLDVPVFSVCSRADLVCDLGRARARRSLQVHGTYAAPEGRAVLRTAARRLWSRADAWPRPLADQTLTATAGEDISRQLRVRVGADHAATVLYENATGLPSGVTLSPSGLLSGSVTTSGSWTVGYTVRNTSPRTSSTAGSARIDVAAAGITTPVISAGGQETCRVRADGRAFCAGDNFAGQIGDGTRSVRLEMKPVGTDTDWVDISTSGGNTCAIKTDTSLWCWGQNTRGQLGIGDEPQQWVPQRVGAGFATVSTGWLATCGVKTDGSLWCWGSNKYGTLGIGTYTDRRQPAQVGDATSWQSVTVGGWHACGLRRDGAASCWGLNDFGQLGINSRTKQSSPVRVPETTFRSLDANWSSTCGITTAGAALCWGINDQGQLGDGSRVARQTPTRVAGGRSWTQITTGDGHTCGLDTAGKAWCWGNNRYGQLGTGSLTSSRTPVRVAGDLSFSSLSTGWMHTCGANTGNQVLCWGNNEFGQLARGNRVQRTTPPGVVAPAGRQKAAAPDGVMTAMSFNILDSVHTKPGGGALWWAPGRIRMEWAATIVSDYQTDLVGFQELNLNQARYLEPALARTYDFYPKSNGLWSEVLNTVGWRTAEWRFVEREILRVPVLGRVRSTHIVRLENRQTGKNIWVLNAHNSPGQSDQAKQDRERATTIQINKLQEKRRQNFPVVFLGDMNDKQSVFCKTTGATDLRAVSGGSTGKTCQLPSSVFLDWMFVSPELAPKSFRYEGNGRTLRVTDHHVLTARLAVPGF